MSPLLNQPAVYIETNRPNGILYLGSTSILRNRHGQHRRADGSHFTRKYGLNRLVWFEYHPDADSAKARETQLKAWRRPWKIRLILESNPDWLDLSIST